MTKYNRITGKVFGGNANATGDNPEIGQFGSAKDGSYIGTSDISSIQALPAWGKGWIGAVTPETNFPPLPEMTGAMKVFSEQQCYLLQQGIPEWDNATIYYKNNFSSKNGKIYISQSDENQGNDPEADTTNWKELLQDKANIDANNFSDVGKSFISGLGMPSNKYINLTLGANGSKYTAPTNGWYSISKYSGASNRYLNLENTTSHMAVGGPGTVSAGDICYYTLPAKKGDVMVVYYNMTGNTVWFRFIYAEGENN